MNEPPTGIKLNMRSLFYNMRHEAFEATGHWTYKPILFIVGFFHAVVQERRKYMKLGWNVNYDFNESDFSVSVAIVRTYLEKSIQISNAVMPWGSLKYLIGEVCEIINGHIMRNHRTVIELHFTFEFRFFKRSFMADV